MSERPGNESHTYETLREISDEVSVNPYGISYRNASEALVSESSTGMLCVADTQFVDCVGTDCLIQAC
jgi:hypothetical protein